VKEQLDVVDEQDEQAWNGDCMAFKRVQQTPQNQKKRCQLFGGLWRELLVFAEVRKLRGTC
jgi:hypothetical protein